MARLSLWGVWLNDGADLTDSLQLGATSALSHSPTSPAQQQVLAGGRIRLAITGPTTNEWQITAARISQDQRDWLVAHVARPLWVRDWLGYKVYGFYATVQESVATGGLMFNVSLKISELTAPSAV